MKNSYPCYIPFIKNLNLKWHANKFLLLMEPINFYFISRFAFFVEYFFVYRNTKKKLRLKFIFISLNINFMLIWTL